MAGRAGEVEAGGIHVHIEIPVRSGHRTVQITMLYGITTTTEKVAGTAGIAARLADLLSHLGDIDTFNDFSGTGRRLRILDDRIAGKTGRLFVDAGRIVAGQTIDVFLGSEVEVFILPAVADMTARARRVVRFVPARIVWTRFCNSGCLSDGISLTGFEG